MKTQPDPNIRLPDSIKQRTLKQLPSEFPIDALRCYDVAHKRRLGPEKDGGYVVADKVDYDCFIAAGVGSNIDFELDFLNLYPSLDCYLFDGHVMELPTSHSRIRFEKKNIAAGNGETTTNLHHLLKSHKNIFMKMDIEGAEFNFLSSLSDSLLKNIKQLVIEIHQPFIKSRWDVLVRLTKNHNLIHLHGNNAGKEPQIILYDQIEVPYSLEATYLRKDSGPIWPSNLPIPSALDFPNIPSKKDITLSGFPYNNG